MVILFSIEKARNQLLQHGVVYTVRKRAKKVGKNWANSGRGTKKICDVKIRFIKKVYFHSDLEDYVELSGFASVDDWLAAINGSGFVLYLYRVEKIYK